jgi:hypothetical protein
MARETEAMSSESSRRELVGALIVACLFTLIHLLLLSFSFDAIDLEELEYGNLAVAILDGIGQPWQSFQTYPREGSRLLLTPLVAPLFALFGASLWTLKLAGILGASLWASTWFLVTRRLVSHGSLLMAASLFVLPMPLIQRAALSASSMFAHLGASTWHGIALLLLLPAATTLRVSNVRLVLSGLTAGLGVFCGFALAPLLPGLAWLVFKRARILGLMIWSAATVPGLLWAFAARNTARLGTQTDLVVGLTGLESGGAFRGEVLSQAIENLWFTFAYGAGFGRVDEATLDVHYLPLGATWFLLAAGVLILAWRTGRDPSNSVIPADKVGIQSLLISTGLYVAVLVFTGFKIEIHYFDGPRYLLPLAPIALVGLLSALSALSHRPHKILFGILLATHVLGFALLTRPSVFPAPWDSVKGFEPWVRRQFLEVELQPEGIEAQRLPRWALWAGLSEAWALEGGGSWSQWQALDTKHRLTPGSEAQKEFWRGFGVGILLATEHDENPRLLAPDTPDEVASLIWQGVAMGYNNVGCQDRFLRTLLTQAPASQRASLWYGFGRADIYCKSYLQGPPQDADKEAFMRGYREGWRLDYWSGEGEATPARAFLDRLYIY